MRKILCPNCKKVLGDTDRDLCANFNCRWCKKTVAVDIKFTKFPDYLSNNYARLTTKKGDV